METENIAPETPEKKPRKTNTIPAKQSVMLALAESVAKKWMATPEIKLLWVKADNFNNLVQEFKTAIGQRVDAGNSRQSKTKLLQNLNNKINKAVEELKIAILGKFGKEDGKSYYSEFGIIKENKAFRLSPDRKERQQGLDTLIKNLEKYQLTVAKYSLDDFKAMQAEYNTLMTETQEIDSTVSAEVGNKNELMKKVEKILNALILIIKGNYPDTYASELRAWGFQKEKY
jgi:hypothetical protein